MRSLASLSILVKGNMSGDEDEPTIISKLSFLGFTTNIEVSEDKAEDWRCLEFIGWQGRKRTLEEQKAACELTCSTSCFCSTNTLTSLSAQLPAIG